MDNDFLFVDCNGGLMDNDFLFAGCNGGLMDNDFLFVDCNGGLMDNDFLFAGCNGGLMDNDFLFAKKPRSTENVYMAVQQFTDCDTTDSCCNGGLMENDLCRQEASIYTECAGCRVSCSSLTQPIRISMEFLWTTLSWFT